MNEAEKVQLDALKRDIDQGIKAIAQLGEWFNEIVPENSPYLWQLGALYFGGVCSSCDGVVMFAVNNGPAEMSCSCPNRLWQFDGKGLVRWIPV